MPSPQKIHVLGISGPSSSGKTTLARLLRDCLPDAFILHEDDFYKTDGEIPINPDCGLADWDCLGSLNLPALEKALNYIRTNGNLPPDLESKEDKNSVGEVEVAPEALQKAKEGFRQTDVPIAIIDGFLLYSQEMKHIRELFDTRLFLRTDYETAKNRREARSGYVTLEGFWADPPGYVDKIVWPNYVKDHAYFFQGGDVEGEVDEKAVREAGLEVMPKEAQGDMTACLEWAVATIQRATGGGSVMHSD